MVRTLPGSMRSFTYHVLFPFGIKEATCVDLPCAYLASWAIATFRHSVTGTGKPYALRLLNLINNCPCKRTVSGCTRAIQFITICPGAFMKQFENQRDSLRDIRRMVYKYLNESVPQNQHRDTELFFHRRLFGVVCPHYTQLHCPILNHDLFQQVNKYGPRPSIPDSCTTDEERLEAISCRWRPIPPATYARKLDDDSLRRCSAMVISPGDFVDVTATVDIVSVGKHVRDKRTHVHFAFTRVVRLLPDKDLIEVSESERRVYHPNSYLFEYRCVDPRQLPRHKSRRHLFTRTGYPSKITSGAQRMFRLRCDTAYRDGVGCLALGCEPLCVNHVRSSLTLPL